MGFILDATSGTLPMLCGSQRMALASGLNDQVLLTFVGWQAKNLHSRRDVQPAMRSHFLPVFEAFMDWDGFLRFCQRHRPEAGVIRNFFEWKFPIVTIVHSGNKSLHVWLSGKDYDQYKIEDLAHDVSRFGVDSGAAVKLSQFFRLPNPIHPTRKQQLLYFDPEFINL
jgi:hypothetical protein